MSHCGNDETGLNALYYMDLNNRPIGKDTTKLCALGLLGHSDYHPLPLRILLSPFITQDDLMLEQEVVTQLLCISVLTLATLWITSYLKVFD